MPKKKKEEEFPKKGFEAEAVVRRDDPTFRPKTTKQEFPERPVPIPSVTRPKGEEIPTRTFTGKQEFQIGNVQLTREEYNTAKGLLGFRGGGGVRTPAVMEAVRGIEKLAPRERLKEEIIKDPEAFGLTPADVIEELPAEIREPRIEQARVQPEPISDFQKTINLLFGNLLEIDPFTGERRIDPTTGQPVQVIGEPVALGGGGFFKVGGRIITNPLQAVKTGKALQIGKRVLDFVKNNKFLSGFIGVGGALLTKDILEGKISERQQALNTAGQEASTIVGDIKTGHIDPRVGLREIDRLEQFVLRQEQLSQEAKISSAVARFTGAMEGFDADVKDALDTLIEARGDILEFQAIGRVPELTPFELNILIRELEDEGYIEKIEFAPFRAEVKTE